MIFDINAEKMLEMYRKLGGGEKCDETFMQESFGSMDNFLCVQVATSFRSVVEYIQSVRYARTTNDSSRGH